MVLNLNHFSIVRGKFQTMLPTHDEVGTPAQQTDNSTPTLPGTLLPGDIGYDFTLSSPFLTVSFSLTTPLNPPVYQVSPFPPPEAVTAKE
jgi:hypothetical protein